MFIFILHFVFVISVQRDSLLPCLKKFLDHDKNNIITEREIETFLLHYMPSPLNLYLSGRMIINTCDLNADGVLTMVDWHHQNACLTKDYQIEYVYQNICVNKIDN